MPRIGSKNLSAIKGRTWKDKVRCFCDDCNGNLVNLSTQIVHANNYGKVKCFCNKCNGKYVNPRTKKNHEKKEKESTSLDSEQSKPKHQKVQENSEPESEKSGIFTDEIFVEIKRQISFQKCESEPEKSGESLESESESESSESSGSESESSGSSEASEASSSSQDSNSSTTITKSTSKQTETRADISSTSFANSVINDPARRSRQRKIDKMNNLEKQVFELTNEINQLKTHVAMLKVEKKCLKERNLDEVNRIKILERKLAEAQQTIINMS